MPDRSVTVRLVADIASYEQKMKQAARTTQDFGRDATDSITKSDARLRSSLETTSQQAFVVGAALTAGFGAAAYASLGFEKELSNLAAVSDATASQLGDLRDQAIAAGNATVFSASDAVTAQAELAKAGVETADIMSGALTGALDLASAGNLDLSRSAEVAAAAMTTFGLSGSDVSRVADTLAAGANKSAAEVEDIAQALQQSGLVADQFGLSMEETVGVLSMFAQAGLNGSDAGTSLKTALQRLVPQSAEAGDKMEQLGLKFFDARGEFVGIDEAAEQLHDRLSGLTQEQRASALQTIFGADAIRAATILYEGGSRGVDDWTAKVSDSGYAAELAATKTDNLAGDVEALKGAFETALISSGTTANDVLRGVAQEATNVVSGLSEMPAPLQAAGLGLVGVSGGGALAFAAVAKVRTEVMEASEALMGMGRGAQFLGRNLSSLVGGVSAAVGIIGVYAQVLGEARAQGAALEADLREGVDTSSLEAVQHALRDLDRERRSLDEAGRDQGFFENWTEGAVSLTAESNEAEKAFDRVEEALHDQEAAFERAGRVSERLGEMFGLTAEDATTLADRFGIDLTDAALNTIPAFAAAFAQMDSGTQSATDLSAAVEGTALELSDAQKAFETSVAGFSDIGKAYQTVIDDQMAAAQALADSTEEATDDAADSWQDYYDGRSVSAQAFLDQLAAERNAQAAWAENLDTIAQRASELGLDTRIVEQLARLGPEAAPLVEEFATGSIENLQRMSDLMPWLADEGVTGVRETIEATTSSVVAAAETLAVETTVPIKDKMAEAKRDTAEAMAAIEAAVRGVIPGASAAGTELGVGIADGLKEALKAAAGDVGNIVAGYASVTVDNLNPILAGIGQPQISNVRRFAQGGIEAHIVDQPTLLYGERQTGGEALIPKYGAADPERVLSTAAAWHGYRIVPISDTAGVMAGPQGADVVPMATGGLWSSSRIPDPPSTDPEYGSWVGYTGEQAMTHTADEARSWVDTNAVPQGSSTGLDPVFLARFNAYNSALGNMLSIVSGFRTYAQQAALYKRYVDGVPGQAPAAKPGSSMHERGLAIDHAPHSTASMRSKAAGFGLDYPMSYEPWHVEPTNVRHYDQGGVLQPGWTMAYNGTGGNEYVGRLQRVEETIVVEVDGAAMSQAQRHHDRLNTGRR